MQQPQTQQVVDHLFRHEAGKMTAVLTRIFGMHHLELAEDVVQEAFLKAVQLWKFEMPPNPAAWLMQTARNKAIDILRRQNLAKQHTAGIAYGLETATAIEQFFSEHEISDSQLRMIFACCHPTLKQEDQVALTLKTVSGFGVAEIARALLTNEAAIKKRLYRAKEFLKESNTVLEIPSGAALHQRLETVYTVLYLLFNEGYNSLKADELIRRDVCAEAMRLCKLLSENKAGGQPATFALLALMCLQASRFNSRMDENNSIILLQHQDRTKWNHALIKKGYWYLNLSSKGDDITVYHIESAIAAEHCMAASFGQTNWQRMLQLYNMLLYKKSTPVVMLNRAVVLAQSGQPAQAVTEILNIPGINTLIQTQYIYGAVLGDMYLTLHNYTQAQQMLATSLALTTSSAEKKLLRQRLAIAQQGLTV